jgi:A/G-specific adenine glycosylase
MLTPKKLSARAIRAFRQTIYRHFQEHGRRLPWRETRDPYCILVSEIMLQQTQVERVLQKYEGFIARFPSFAALAEAALPEVLAAWQGLGYNRRALALKRLAEKVVSEFGGSLPDSPEVLTTLPGIGSATAGALAAFAFTRPAIFIETNIRRVFLHFFFPHQDGVRDRDLLPLVEQTLDREDPRRWYYALMDYGVWLKKEVTNPNRRSAHYNRQSPFVNSDRQVRGLILKILLEHPSLTQVELAERVGQSPARTGAMLRRLAEEGFLNRAGEFFLIASGKGQRH